MRHNNFDALRLAAALLVVHGHGWELTGAPAPGIWNEAAHHLGLDIFFAISGYLVTGSWERRPRLGDFLVKRSLRILPGLTACVALTVFVLGPIATTVPLAHYFAAGGLLYLANIALLLQLELPGVFAHTSQHAAVNGSLWSLAPEFCCYLTVPALALLRGRLRLAGTVALALVAGTVSLALFKGVLPQLPEIWNCDPKYALAEAPYFAIGGFYGLVEMRLARRGAAETLWRADLCLAFLVLNSCVSAWYGNRNLPVEWLTLPYMVICFGRMALPVLSRAGRFGDASYGTYLYAWPIQKIVLLAWPANELPVLTCAALSLGAGLVSWHLVEKPAQRLGARLLRRARVPGSRPGGHAQQAAERAVDPLALP